jgi:hypothetical protein
MTLKTDLKAEIAALQARLVILNSVGEDIYSFGTVALFSANSNSSKWYYKKVGEELWKQVNGSVEKSLAEWVLESVESSIGYFEVYILVVPELPFYASE